MDAAARRERLRSFLLGGIVGAGAALVAGRSKQQRKRRTPAGLAAFEQAPCYEETLRKERATSRF